MMMKAAQMKVLKRYTCNVCQDDVKGSRPIFGLTVCFWTNSQLITAIYTQYFRLLQPNAGRKK